jgi:tetratricopeptide (TPR) repeat protein
MNRVTRWNFKKADVESISTLLLQRTKLINVLKVLLYIVIGLGIFDIILYYFAHSFERMYDPGYPGFFEDPEVKELIFTVCFLVVFSTFVIKFSDFRYALKRRSIFVTDCDPRKYIAVIDSMLAKKPSLFSSLYLKEDAYVYVTALNHLKEFDKVYARLDELTVKNKKIISLAQNSFLRGMTLAAQDRLDESRSCLDYLDKCINSGKIRGANYQKFNVYRDTLEASIYYHCGDYAKAAVCYRNALNSPNTRLFSRLDKVVIKYGLAKAEYALGNYMSAYTAIANANELICDTPHPIAADIRSMYEEMNAKINKAFE